MDSIILYGSYARGDNDAYSDVDIMILVKSPKESIKQHREKLNIIASRVGLKYDLLLAFVVKDKTSFENKIEILPFYQNIKKEGKVLYAA